MPDLAANALPYMVQVLVHGDGNVRWDKVEAIGKLVAAAPHLVA